MVLYKKDESLSQNFSHFTLTAIDAALKAGELLKKGFGTSFAISSKEGIHNLVTEYDHKAEELIIGLLKKSDPNSHFLAEESGSSGNQDTPLLWVVDPLDGTVNFAHGIPLFSISIALQKEGELHSGVIYVPMLNELFVAEKGKGAYLNNHRIQVSSTLSLTKSILATGFPYNIRENPFDCIDHFIEILKLGIPIRRIGSAAIDLAYTASGRFEGFFEVGLSPWDCAAGVLLVEEAKGKVTDWDETPFNLYAKKPILATNGSIHQTLAKVLMRSS